MINVKKQFLQILITPALLISVACKGMNSQQNINLCIPLMGKLLIKDLNNKNAIGYATQEVCNLTNGFFNAAVLKTTDLCIPAEVLIRNDTVINPTDPEAFFNWMQKELPKNLFDRIRQTFDAFFLGIQNQETLIINKNSNLKILETQPLPVFLLPIHMVIGNSKLKMSNLCNLFNLHLTFDQHELLFKQLDSEQIKTSLSNCKPFLFLQSSDNKDWQTVLNRYFLGQLSAEYIPRTEEYLFLLNQKVFNHFITLQQSNLLFLNPSYQEATEDPIRPCLLLNNCEIIAYESNSLIHNNTGGLHQIRCRIMEKLNDEKVNIFALLQQRSTGKTQLGSQLLSSIPQQ